MTQRTSQDAPVTDETVVSLALYRSMLRIRRFEEAAKKNFDEGLIRGALHLCIGQEATVAGACSALRDGDYMTGNHRSHGHPIGKGAALGPLMAELLARTTGVCKGRGGSLHLADFSVGSLGESGIVAGAIPVAVGAALTAQIRQSGGVALAFFGDGATSEGVFHESVNLATLWRLPVVFLCENNLYAGTVALAQMTPTTNVADRALGFGIPGVVVDGQNVLAVRAATLEAVERARQGMGPSIVECRTYRFEEHAYRLPIKIPYRTKEEVDRWRAERDPISLYRDHLIQTGSLATDLDRIDAEVQAEISAAVEFATSSPRPDPAACFDDLYVETI